MNFEFWFSALFGIVLFLFGSTYLLKRFAGVEAHYIYSIWRMERFRRFIGRTYFLHRFVDLIAKLGLILGFGVLASDYLFARKQGFAKRVVVAVLTVASLFFIYYNTLYFAIDIAPLTSNYSALLTLAFSVFGISLFGLLLLVVNGIHILQNILIGEAACPGIAPVIPGVQIPKVPVFIPWYGWIALFFSMIVHESAHGIQILRERLTLKSAGLLLIGLLPIGAFVEPDEEELKKAEPKKSMCVYSAGPAANLLFMVVFWLIGFWFFNTFYQPVAEKYESVYLDLVEKVQIESVSERIPYCGNPKAPAYGILKPGMEIIAIDNIEIKNTEQLKKVLAQRPFAERIFTVKDLDGKIKEFKIKPNQELGTFGIVVKDVLKEGAKVDEQLLGELYFIRNIYGFIMICFLLSFLLALVNLLPVIPFDGGKIASTLYATYFLQSTDERAKKRIEDIMLYFFLFIAFLNVLPFFL